MRTVRRLGVLIVMGLVGLGPGLAAVGTGHAAGVNYYVSTSGADSTCKAGQSSSTPLAHHRLCPQLCGERQNHGFQT
jgi:hypothetical protein